MCWTYAFALAVLLKSTTAFTLDTYLGCYKENITRNTTEQTLKRSQNMTRSLCVQHCRLENMSVYGLMYGTYCYCSTNAIDFTSMGRVQDGKCKKICTGAPKCGGNDVVAAYNGSKYHKCYQSGGNTLKNYGGQVDNLKMESCLKACENLFFKYTFLTQSNKCYCSNMLPLTSLVDDDKCLKRGNGCLGEEKCGGGAGVIAVWRIGTSTQSPRNVAVDVSPEDCPVRRLPFIILGTFFSGFVVALLICYWRQTNNVKHRNYEEKRKDTKAAGRIQTVELQNSRQFGRQAVENVLLKDFKQDNELGKEYESKEKKRHVHNFIENKQDNKGQDLSVSVIYHEIEHSAILSPHDESIASNIDGKKQTTKQSKVVDIHERRGEYSLFNRNGKNSDQRVEKINDHRTCDHDVVDSSLFSENAVCKVSCDEGYVDMTGKKTKKTNGRKEI